MRKAWVIMFGVGVFVIPVMGQNQTVGNPYADTDSIMIAPPPKESLVTPPDEPETDCVKSTAFFYNDWIQFGKPACWCYPRNCRGDADGKGQGGICGITYVFSNDLQMLISAWYIKEPPKGPGIGIGDALCADFDRREQGNSIIGFWRIGSGDLNILIAHWNVKQPPRGPGIPDCMDTGHYNFFVNP